MNMMRLLWLIMCISTIFMPVFSQEPNDDEKCKDAPTEALRKVCRQLYKLDDKSRASQALESTTSVPTTNADIIAAEPAQNGGAANGAPGGAPSESGGGAPSGAPGGAPGMSGDFFLGMAGDLAAPAAAGDATTPGPSAVPQKAVATGEDPCKDAPNKSFRFICHHLQKWDQNARSAPPVETAIPKMPSIAGLPPPDLMAAELAPVPAIAAQCMDLGCLCRYMGGNAQDGSNNCQMPNGQPLRKAVRKEYRMLSDDERARFHAALKAIKQSGEYDNIARIHQNPVVVGGAHAGPAFLPWHREYLKRMEIALRQVDPSVAIPYWDSSIEDRLPTPAHSHMFTPEFMGSTDEAGNLVHGDFANWRTLEGHPNVRRIVGKDGGCLKENELNWIWNQVGIEQILAFSAPQPGVCSIRMIFNWPEVIHNMVHLFVGGNKLMPNGTEEADGDMADTATSANDPIFFLHHAFLDFIWEQWRQTKQNRNDREKAYPMDNAQCASPQHFGSAPMRPFQPWQNVDGLSNKYTDNMYEYAPRPSCNMGENCGSKYLFCDRSKMPPHCAPKIRQGGNCTGYENRQDVCMNGICQNGRCQQTQRPPSFTPSPPVVTTTPIGPHRPGVQVACYNEHECCSTWAQQGQCQQNQGYMYSWCKASCGQCTPDYNMNQECSDRHPNCQNWASQGQCQRNRHWMTENCRQSCGHCAVSRQQVCGGGQGSQQNQDRITIAPPTQGHCTSPGCYNENICCQLWGLAGECRRNPFWMGCYCRVSCGRCIPVDYDFGACADYHQRCREWANAGECRRNAWMLENCRWSCGTCVDQSRLRQICRMQNGRRKRDSAMPSIEFEQFAEDNEPGIMQFFIWEEEELALNKTEKVKK